MCSEGEPKRSPPEQVGMDMRIASATWTGSQSEACSCCCWHLCRSSVPPLPPSPPHPPTSSASHRVTPCNYRTVVIERGRILRSLVSELERKGGGA